MTVGWEAFVVQMQISYGIGRIRLVDSPAVTHSWRIQAPGA